jgi:AcrR family transcriptional regulator
MSAATPAREPTLKPLRADARRNRDRVLAAAREAFVADGPTVSLDEIARRAGVGAGTVHRHFPTKEELFEAVIVDRLVGLTEIARELGRAVEPGEAFFRFFHQLVEEARHNLALSAALTEAGADAAARDIARQAGSGLQDALATLLVRAQKAGAVRRDINAGDLHSIVVGVIAMQRGRAAGLPAGPGLAVVTDGLRANPYA